MEQFHNIYDRLNGQPHIQELIQDFYYESILSPIADQAKEAFKLNNLHMKAIILGHRLLVDRYRIYEDTGDLGRGILDYNYVYLGRTGPLSWQLYRNASAINKVNETMLETTIGEGIFNID